MSVDGAQPVSGVAQPVSGVAQPVSGVDRPVSGRRRMLAPVVVPFAVAVPYRIRVDMTHLGHLPAPVDDPGPATLLRLDDGAPRALAHLLDELEAAPDAIRWADPEVGPARWRDLAAAIANRLADAGDPRVAWSSGAAGEHPDLDFPWLGLRVAADGALVERPLDPAAPAALAGLAPRAAAALRRLPPAARPLDALRLAVAEDLALLLRDVPGDGGRVAYLQVAAASGWDPGARGGSGLAELHEPVPHAAQLLKAAPAVADAMVERGPFVRYVWSLAADDVLSHHPRRHPARSLDGVPPADWWYRAERQTTLPLPEVGASLFAIRVLHAPLAEIVADPERRARMAAAVRSMDVELLAYKGMSAAAPPLLAWLEGR